MPTTLEPVSRDLGQRVPDEKQVVAFLSKQLIPTFREARALLNRLAIALRDGSLSVDGVNVMDYGAKGDGATDDRAAFVAAIAAIKTTGGRLYLPSGKTFLISSRITVQSYTGLTIESLGNATIQLTKNNGFALFVSCTNLRIRGLHINGTIQTDGGDPGGGNIQQTAITLTSCSEVDVSHNRIENTGGYAVYPNGGNYNIHIHHNDFIATMAGVQAGGGAGIVNTDLRICDNTFVGFIPTTGAGTLGSDDQIGVFGGLASCLRICGNFIDKRGIDATSQAKMQARCINVNTSGTGADVRDVIIQGNICVNSYSSSPLAGRQAIVVADFAGLGNLTHVLVADNIVRTACAGVDVNGGGTGLADLTVSRNHITDIRGPGGVTTPWGINVQIGTLDARMVIEGNDVDTTASYGIILTSSGSVLVRGNSVKNPGNRGILIGGLYSDWTLEGNQVYTGTVEGIYLTGGANVKLIGNTVSGCTGLGIGVDTCTNVIAIGNVARGNGSVGFYCQSITDACFIGNEASGNATHGLVTVVAVNNLRLIGNDFHGNTQFGMSLQGTNCSIYAVANNLTGNTSGAMQDVLVTSRKYFVDNPELTVAAVANSRGQGTIANAATNVAVAFPTAEPDANYMVVATSNPQAGAAASTAYVTAKTVNGFTLNITVAPGAGQTTLVDWRLSR